MGVENWSTDCPGPSYSHPGQSGAVASIESGPHPPASHLAHFSGALPAPTFRPAEPRTPLSLPPGGQSSWRGGVLGAGSSGGRSLGLRPRFLPPARLFSSFWGTKESWLRCLGGGSAEVRNQFWGEESSNGDPGQPATAQRRPVARGCAHASGPAQEVGVQSQETMPALSVVAAHSDDHPVLPCSCQAGPSRPVPISPPETTPPGQLCWASAAPRPTHLCVGLEDVVLDPALGAELLCAQQAAVLPHQVVPLQDRCPTATRGARRQTAASAGALGKGRSPLLRAPRPRPGQQAHLCPCRRGTPAGKTTRD